MNLYPVTRRGRPTGQGSRFYPRLFILIVVLIHPGPLVREVVVNPEPLSLC